MKKSLIIFIIILYSNVIGFTQEKGDFRLGMYGQTLSFRDQILPQFGLVGEYFLSHNFSMNYRYGLGYNSNGDIMGHINLSLIGIAYAASMSSTSDELLWTFMIPEGFSYHAYPNDFLEIAPYVNPLGSEINLYENTSIMLSCAFGMNIHFKFDDFSFTPNLGAIIMYGNGEIVPAFGFSINYNFKDRP
jgi:hypothetical protein